MYQGKNVGFIGLGLMGLPMAQHVIKRGFNLYIWTRAGQCKGLADPRVFICKSITEISNHVDILFLCVTDGDAVKEILFSQGGFLSYKNQGKVIIDHSTILPQEAKNIAKKTKDYGSYYLDAPITGSVPGAIAGTLITFVGGDKNILNHVTPLLNSFCKKINYMGTHGSGQLTKLCNQIMLLNTLLASFEMVNFASKSKINVKNILKSLEHSLIDSQAWRIFCRSAYDQHSKNIAHIKDVVKDLQYIDKTSKNNNARLYSTKNTLKVLKILMDKDLGKADLREISQLFK